MGSGHGRGASAKPAAAPKAADKDDGLVALAQRARASKQKLRVEGYANPGDVDRVGSSLANANQVRDGLVKNGVPLDLIDVYATGQASAGESARVLAVDAAGPVAAQPAATSDEPLGDAYFLTNVPLDVEKDHSAMVSVLSADVKAEPVYFYDPVSARGSKRFAFRAVLLENRASTRSTPARSRSTPTASSWVRACVTRSRRKAGRSCRFRWTRSCSWRPRRAGAKRSIAWSPCSAACSPPKRAASARPSSRS
jgi:hypothetical protein